MSCNSGRLHQFGVNQQSHCASGRSTILLALKTSLLIAARIPSPSADAGDMDTLIRSLLPLQRLSAATLVRAIVADAEGYAACVINGPQAATQAGTPGLLGLAGSSSEGSAAGTPAAFAAPSPSPSPSPFGAASTISTTGSGAAASPTPFGSAGSHAGGIQHSGRPPLQRSNSAFAPGSGSGSIGSTSEALDSKGGGLDRSASAGSRPDVAAALAALSPFASPNPPLPESLRRQLASNATTLLEPAVLPLMPLPPPCRSLCTLPEHIIADMADLLRWTIGPSVQAVHPINPRKGNASVFYEDAEPSMRAIATAFAALLASPLHVHNPYLRGKLIKALQLYLPPRTHPSRYEEDASSIAARCLPPLSRSVRYVRTALHGILPTHELAVATLAPAVMAFHVDIAHSGAHAGFYTKFEERMVSQHYSRRTCQHRNAGPGLSTACTRIIGLYVRFLISLHLPAGLLRPVGLPLRPVVAPHRRDRVGAAGHAALG